MKKFIIIFLMLFFIINSLDYDSTDKGFTKSGLGLYIDNATGCHYLTAGFSGITPRLDNQGKHICSGYEFEGKAGR